MALTKEISFTDEHINYNFTGTYDIYILEGSCSFKDSTLYDVSGSVYINRTPDVPEDKEMIGTFSYNSYIEDRASYNFYIDREHEKHFTSLLVAIVDEIRKGK